MRIYSVYEMEVGRGGITAVTLDRAANAVVWSVAIQRDLRPRNSEPHPANPGARFVHSI